VRISGISLFNVELLPPKGRLSHRRTLTSCIVRVDTDEGISGFGEVVPFTAGIAEASTAGLIKNGEVLLGEDPFHVDKLTRIMDGLFAHNWGFGGVFHNEVKTALDMAFWDIMGLATGRPVSDLLGGRYEGPIRLYEAVYTGGDRTRPGDFSTSPDQVASEAADLRRQGYSHLMIKTGRDPVRAIERIEAACSAMQPGDTVIAHAGGRLPLYDAVRVGRAFVNRDLPVTLIIDQPCTSLDDCVAFRSLCPGLLVELDELVYSADAVVEIHRRQAAEICNLEISRLGGLTRARRVRDLCIELGMKVVPQCRMGSDVGGAAVIHYAQSTDPDFYLNTFYFPSLTTTVTADGCPSPDNGFITASTAPGLGLTLDPDVLGKPVAVVGTPALS
jgi:cis-L-3-hydroxyproline dehydratase